MKKRNGRIFGGTQKYFAGTQVEKHWGKASILIAS
jgi:hypothetical protein